MPPTTAQVHGQLNRILASEGFTNADRMSGFLRYVVERALAGEADQVKEYAIGVDVFGRDVGFDPRLDSIVRVEARRLRAKVDEYYAGAGAADDVLIQLRRGSYVPSFELRVLQPTAASTEPFALERTDPARSRGWTRGLGLGLILLGVAAAALTHGRLWAIPSRPAPEMSIAVLPFSEYSSDPANRLMAARLTDGVTAALAGTGAVAVAAHTSVLTFSAPPHRSVAEIAAALDADLVLEGSVDRTGEGLRVNIRLVNPATQRKIWVEDFAGDDRDIRSLERRIAATVAAAAAKAGRAR